MKQALHAGILISEFWHMTPKETDQAIEAALWQDERQQKQALQAAWLGAALERQKRMPSLQKLMTGPAKKLHGPELRKRRAEYAQMASAENVAAINAHMRKKKVTDGIW